LRLSGTHKACKGTALGAFKIFFVFLIFIISP
jgi:hypothetical protein